MNSSNYDEILSLAYIFEAIFLFINFTYFYVFVIGIRELRKIHVPPTPKSAAYNLTDPENDAPIKSQSVSQIPTDRPNPPMIEIKTTPEDIMNTVGYKERYDEIHKAQKKSYKSRVVSLTPQQRQSLATDLRSTYGVKATTNRKARFN